MRKSKIIQRLEEMDLHNCSDREIVDLIDNNSYPIQLMDIKPGQVFFRATVLSDGETIDFHRVNLEQQLIGEWVIYQNNGVQINYIFNADHTGNMKRYKNGNLTQEINITWSLMGSVLTMTASMNGQTSTQTVEISIEGDVLHITQDGETYDFHRVK